jgi:hypothetical protein
MVTSKDPQNIEFYSAVVYWKTLNDPDEQKKQMCTIGKKFIVTENINPLRMTKAQALGYFIFTIIFIIFQTDSAIYLRVIEDAVNQH